MSFKSGHGQRGGGQSDVMRGSTCHCCLRRGRKGSQPRCVGWDLEARNGKEIVPPPESPERNTAFEDTQF